MSGVRIKLVIADVDGTLVTGDKVLTDMAMQAVHDLHDAGIAFAITSGRPPRGMSMLVAPLALQTPIAGFNGGVFVNPDLSVIETRSLPPEVANEAVRAILRQGLDAWIYSADQWFVRDANAPHVSREAWTVKFPPEIVATFDAEHLASVVKIVGVSDDHAAVEAAEHAAQQELGAKASSTRSQPYYLDITNPAANKGCVVQYLSEMLGIARENIATIGDGANDVLMFQQSGVAIAMGNASDAVKARANEVTDSNENEGFAAAMRRFVLQGAEQAG